MKFALFAIGFCSVNAFAPSTQPAFRLKALSMGAVVTGPHGKPATSKEEDLELTRQIILAYIGEDAPAAEPTPAPAHAEA
jgi:hypothetical protein